MSITKSSTFFRQRLKDRWFGFNDSLFDFVKSALWISTDVTLFFELWGDRTQHAASLLWSVISMLSALIGIGFSFSFGLLTDRTHEPCVPTWVSAFVRSWREAWSLSMRTTRLYLLVRISAIRLRSQMFSAPSSKCVSVHCAPVCAPVWPAVNIIIVMS